MAEGTIRIGPVVVRKRLAREVKMVELTSDSQAASNNLCTAAPGLLASTTAFRLLSEFHFHHHHHVRNRSLLPIHGHGQSGRLAQLRPCLAPKF